MFARRNRLGLFLPLLLAAGPGLAQWLPPIDGAETGGSVVPLAGGPTGGFTMNSTRSLNFGRFVAGTGGTITIAPTGARSRSGGVILINSAGTGSAGFSVTQVKGGATRAVVISVPANGTVSISNGSSSMAVGNFTNGSGTVLQLTSAGALLDVGATLTVAPNQARGNYSGTFNLTVNYQ
jgi:hypothetical protein